MMELYKNKKWLYQKYIKENLSTLKIARICKCGKTTINKYLRRFEVPLRPQAQYMHIDKPFKYKTWLRRKYEQENLSTKEIAKICGCGKTTINNALRKFNIPLKEKGGIITKKEQLHNRRYLKQQYVGQKKSTSEIALQNDTHRSYVRILLIKFNIKRRSKSEYMRLIYKKKRKNTIELGWRWLFKNGFAHRVPKEIRTQLR